VGPSTGMPTRTQQCDVMLCAYASHGDTRHVLLFPANPKECFELAPVAFDLAERLQTPVFVLSDLDIGMNDWMVPEFTWNEAYTPDRGKVLSADQIEALPKFHRYLDTDGDAIPYRTLPGVHAKGAYFTRGSGHNQWGAYTEDSGEYREVLDRLARKFETAKSLVPPAVLTGPGDHAIGLLSYGSGDEAIKESLDQLAAAGVHADYLRVRAFPFGPEVDAFLGLHDRVYVIEQNRDAQLRSLLLLESAAEKRQLKSVLHYDGLPMTARFVTHAVLADLGSAPSAVATCAEGASA